MTRKSPVSCWTGEQDAELTRLWLGGFSASRIAANPIFAGRSRNAVIGRVHRLGIQGSARFNVSKNANDPDRPKNPRRENPRRDMFKVLAVKKPPAPYAPRIVAPVDAPMIENDRWLCQFIAADSDLASAPKCGKTRIRLNGRDSSYCAEHHARLNIGRPEITKARAKRDTSRLQSAHFW